MHERLEVMGGKLGIESAPGKGTRMTLVAPLHLPRTGNDLDAGRSLCGLGVACRRTGRALPPRLHPRAGGR